MTVFDLILMRYLLHYGPILVKKCRVIFCIMRYAIFSLRYTFLKVIMQRTNTAFCVVTPAFYRNMPTLAHSDV